MLDLPSNAPGWLGWVLFGLLLVVSVLREIQNARAGSVQREKVKAETQKIRLDMLGASADGYIKQIEVIKDVMTADPLAVPSRRDLRALENRGRRRPGLKHNAAQIAHLGARIEAREGLPDLLDRLGKVRNQQAQLERDLGVGVTVAERDIASIKDDMDAVGEDLRQLIRLLSESPRILVRRSDEPLPAGREGDLITMVEPEDYEDS
ncbi:hypothetical protein [uncultured Cellulomonas sp.]|uniref:hypothetical protein n=1 Tax=uncultured Cellulomonas sp. TaxID=189682 RepID=UPI0026215139|nr:hypothetical protein [uncultured Cellulomonas sp.]